METNKKPSVTYETGVTQPCKSYRGVIAALLMIVIFLSGAVTALGLMNVELFRKLQSGEGDMPAPVSFEAPNGEEQNPYARMDAGTQITELGIWYAFISGVSNRYYEIPKGPMITDVTEQAELAGIRSGDILREVMGRSVETEQALRDVLEENGEAEQVTLILYRPSKGEEIEILLPVIK